MNDIKGPSNVDRLVASLANAASSSNQKSEKVVAQSPEGSSAPTDAVSVDSAFGSGASDPQKLARIKEQVQSGSYSVPSKEVASALIRDLGI